MTREETKVKTFDVLRFIADNAGLSIYEAIEKAYNMGLSGQEQKTIQEKQAESEKYQKAYDDGYDNGYAQARFDYEQESKTGWIPVSERLPDDHDWYVIVVKEKSTGYQYIPRIASHNHDNCWSIIDTEDADKDWLDDLECVAWMPLPEPYKAESEEKNEF